MATATIKHGAHKLLGRDKPSASDPPPVNNEKCQQEKQNLSNFFDDARPLAPDQVAECPRKKDLATSSKNLRIQDFELIRTLGTGTFARVWLACLAGSSHNADECKVFALKILRKSDSKRAQKELYNREQNLPFNCPPRMRLFEDVRKNWENQAQLICSWGHNARHHTTTSSHKPPYLSLTTPTPRICEGRVKFPRDMDPNARSLISGLCTVNPTHRLGNLSGGVDRVKSHPFFTSIDWESLYYRKIKGPIIPNLRHPADASNFEEYDPAPEQKSVYTKEMASKYDNDFKDF
ncbi:MAG: hypothetical protein Q9201_000751 [Fulgogasparrea decipioides]